MRLSGFGFAGSTARQPRRYCRKADNPPHFCRLPSSIFGAFSIESADAIIGLAGGLAVGASDGSGPGPRLVHPARSPERTAWNHRQAGPWSICELPGWRIGPCRPKSEAPGTLGPDELRVTHEDSRGIRRDSMHRKLDRRHSCASILDKTHCH